MVEQSLEDLVILLAILGAVALAIRFVRTGLRLALRAAQVTTAAGLAEVSARRGDLTGMAERRAEAQQARRERRRDLLLTAVWFLWFAAPLFTSWTAEAYAVAAPLWLLRPPKARK